MCTIEKINLTVSQPKYYRQRSWRHINKSDAQATWNTFESVNSAGEHCTIPRTLPRHSAIHKVGELSLLNIIIGLISFSAIMESSLTLAAALSHGLPGFDVSNYQRTVDFTSASNAGAQFVIIKVGVLPSYI